MLKGLLVSESLRTGAELNIALHVDKIWRVETAGATAAQPTNWTLIQFTAPDAEAERLAAALSDCLSPIGRTDPARPSRAARMSAGSARVV